MDADTFSKQQIIEGVRLLAELLPEARKKSGDFSAKKMSGLAKAVQPHMREDNFGAMIIHQPPTGGWIADLMLRIVPEGVSNILGTPVGHPLATYAEARESALMLLATVLALSKDTTAETGEPVFLYYSSELPVLPDLLQMMRSLGAKYDSEAHALARLAEITKELFPGGYTFEALEKISKDRDRMAMLMSVVHMAMMHGIMRFPPVVPGRPGDPSVKH